MRTISGMILFSALAMAQPAPPIPQNTPRMAASALNAQVISKIPPAYPADAKAARIQGVVKLDVLIGTDGRVAFVKPLEGPAALMQSAVDAVSQWVYQPVLLNGAPTAVVTQVDVNFTLQQ